MKHKTQKTEYRENKESVRNTVLDRIEEVTPYSKVHFVFRDALFWVLFAISIIVGAAGVAAMLFTAMNIGWEFHEATHDNLVTFLASTLPYVWFIILIGMVLLGYFDIRHTKRGYKYSLHTIVGISVAGSIVGGVVLHGAGMSRAIDEGIGRHIPLHSPALTKQEEMWTKPENGLLAGNVEYVDVTEDTVVLESFDKLDITINIEELRQSDIAVLESKKRVRVVGVEDEDGVFYACHVLPFDVMERPFEFKKMRENREAFMVRLREFERQREEFLDLRERKEEHVRSSKCLDVRPDRKQPQTLRNNMRAQKALF